MYLSALLLSRNALSGPTFRYWCIALRNISPLEFRRKNGNGSYREKPPCPVLLTRLLRVPVVRAWHLTNRFT